jgi:hypothetical protein
MSMNGILRRLTYANVMATLALFVALGGASYAAFKLPKNSVGAKQLKAGAVTPAKLNRGSIGRLAGAQGPRGLVGPQGAIGPQGPIGVQGPLGPAGSAKAWAEYDGNIESVLHSSGGISISKLGTGRYCVNAGVFNATNSVALATIDGSMAGSNPRNQLLVSNNAVNNSCPDPTREFEVVSYSYTSPATYNYADLGFVVAVM